MTHAPLSQTQINHRADFASFATRDGEEWHRQWETNLIDHWTAFNAKYFDNRLLVPPYITLSQPASRSRLQQTTGPQQASLR